MKHKQNVRDLCGAGSFQTVSKVLYDECNLYDIIKWENNLISMT